MGNSAQEVSRDNCAVKKGPYEWERRGDSCVI